MTNKNNEWLTIGEVAKEFKISQQTLRCYANNNTIPCLRLPNSGHRRFKRCDIHTWLGIVENARSNNILSETPLAIVARVSSKSQNLQNQIDRVEKYTLDKFGDVALKNASKYYCVGSGFNFELPEMLGLCREILDGHLQSGYVIATTPDRICRTGKSLFEQICQYGGCSICYIAENGDTSEESIMEEFLAFCTHFTAKASGLKGASVCKKILSRNTLQKCYLLYKQGHSYRSCHEILKKEGLNKDINGTLISRNVVRTELQKNWDVLEEENPDIRSSFAHFAGLSLTKQKSSKCVISRVKIVDEYKRWCQQEEIVPMSNSKIGYELKEFMTMINVVKRLGKTGNIIYRNVHMLKCEQIPQTGSKNIQVATDKNDLEPWYVKKWEDKSGT